MTQFEMRPVEAMQFETASGAGAIYEFVQKYRPGVSMATPTRETLRFYNSGPELTMNVGDWVVAFAGEILVVSAEAFGASVK